LLDVIGLTGAVLGVIIEDIRRLLSLLKGKHTLTARSKKRKHYYRSFIFYQAAECGRIAMLSLKLRILYKDRNKEYLVKLT
jgi:hypothetical protein